MTHNRAKAYKSLHLFGLNVIIENMNDSICVRTIDIRLKCERRQDKIRADHNSAQYGVGTVLLLLSNS